MAKYFQYSFIPGESADSAFAQIETNESIELSSSLTGSSDDFTVDQADIYVLRAITNLATDWPPYKLVMIGILKWGRWKHWKKMMTLHESLVGLNPNFVGIRNSSMLAKSKAFMQNAIDLYGLASPLLRDRCLRIACLAFQLMIIKRRKISVKICQI